MRVRKPAAGSGRLWVELRKLLVISFDTAKCRRERAAGPTKADLAVTTPSISLPSPSDDGNCTKELELNVA